MSSQTKILVLHRRILIYALIALVGLLTIIAIIIISSRQLNHIEIDTAANFYDAEPVHQTDYIPGIYASTMKLGESQFEITICVDAHHINSISMKSADDAISTMYPLLDTTMAELSQKIIDSQSLENISYSTEYRYTNLTILSAIQKTLDKAKK